MKALKNKLRPFYRNYQAKKINTLNFFRYGSDAPKYEEIVWVDPKNCTNYICSIYLRKTFNLSIPEARAKVIETPWPKDQVESLLKVPLMQNCIAHWVDGLPWEDTGEYERMEKLIKTSKTGVSHGCKTRDDIIERCRNLDRIFEQAKKDKRLRSQKEIEPEYYWGAKEILIHIGPGGEILKGGEGMHRFAISYILEIPFPAHISFIHVSALPYLRIIRVNNYYDVCISEGRVIS